MRRLLILLAALAVVTAACGTASDVPAVDTSAPTTASSDTPTTSTQASTSSTAAPTPSTDPAQLAEVTIDLTTCDTAGEFAILCEAYDLLTSQYVDPLDDQVLADGASQGIQEFLEETEAPAATGPRTLTCPLPADAFEATCESAATVLATFDTSITSVAEAAVFGLFEYGIDDPNSQYLPPRVLDRLSEEQTGTISGIGSLVITEEVDEFGETVRCNVITETCKMSIVSVIDDGPAQEAGLMSGDVMVSVDGESILGWTSEEIVAAVRGPEGEAVTIEIDRDGVIISFTIVRAPITVPVTETELLDDGIGYVKLSQFTNNSGGLFRDALEEMIDAGATRLIIDLQNNPGGALNAAIAVASQFLDDGLVLRTESPGDETVYDVTSGGVATSDALQIVVLVNRGSASASEVVAGVLQETDRAVIIGEPTFGKNTVQQQYNLSNGGAVKVTIARWVTPAGTDFGGDGIQPDVAVTIPDDADTDFLIEQAVAYLTTTAGG